MRFLGACTLVLGLLPLTAPLWVPVDQAGSVAPPLVHRHSHGAYLTDPGGILHVTHGRSVNASLPALGDSWRLSPLPALEWLPERVAEQGQLQPPALAQAQAATLSLAASPTSLVRAQVLYGCPEEAHGAQPPPCGLWYQAMATAAGPAPPLAGAAG